MNNDVDQPAPAPTLTIPLSPPVEHDGSTHFVLDLQEPLAAHLYAVDHFTGFRWRLELVAAVAGIPADALRRCRISTFNAAFEYVADWLVHHEGQDQRHASTDPLAAAVAGRC